MKKITLLLTSLLCLSWSATQEQVMNYLSLSKADRELIEIEQVFDNMRQNLDTEDNSSNEINQRYSEYLQEHLSDNEMEELIQLYQTPIMQRFVTEMDLVDIPQEEMENFLLSLKEEPLEGERQDIIDEIVKLTVKDEEVINFYKSMTQRYGSRQKEKSPNTNKENNSTQYTPQEQQFLEGMKKGAKNALLYGTQVLGMEEMSELRQALKSSIISKASNVESEAMIDVMDNFIQNIRSKPKENNSTR